MTAGAIMPGRELLPIGRGGKTTESIVKGPTAQRLETMKPWSTSQRINPGHVYYIVSGRP